MSEQNINRRQSLGGVAAAAGTAGILGGLAARHAQPAEAPPPAIRA